MKCLQRYLCVFSCLVVLFCVSSIPVSAEEIEHGIYRVYSQAYLYSYDAPTRYAHAQANCFPFDGIQQNSEASAYVNIEDKLQLVSTHTVISQSNEVLIPQGNNTVVLIANINDRVRLDKPSDSTTNNIMTFSHRANASVNASVTFTDGSSVKASGKITTRSNGTKDIEISFIPDKDVSQIYFSITSNWSINDIQSYCDVLTDSLYRTLATVYVGELDANGYEIKVDQQSEEAGLLASLIEWVKSIKEGVTNTINAIKELPTKIWQYIEDGLKSLFIPTEEAIEEIKDKFDTMLENKFGAVYQVINLTFESWEQIQEADAQNTINVPSVEINLPQNEKFSFGDFEVAIVPPGFEFMTNIIKMFVGALCTIAFINGLRKRYEEVMGVET